MLVPSEAAACSGRLARWDSLWRGWAWEAGEAGGKETQGPTYLISPASLSDATTVISTPSTLRPRALAAFRQDDPTDSELSGTTGRSTGPPLRQGRDSSPAPSPTIDSFPSALEQVLPSSATDVRTTS